MNGLTVIGDVHGKIREYYQIIQNCERSICVGDFGFKDEWDWHFQNVTNSNHQINMGNHDYLPYLDRTPSLGDFSHDSDIGLVTIRGAWSIDRIHRKEGLDWFENEEISYQDGLFYFDEFCRIKPKIVISHDCPESIRQTFFGIFEKSNTSNLLQAMFQEHQPELWIFGHHHKHRDSEILGTRFICLEELETFEIAL